MKCLVTGGAGFIGSNLVELLIEKGHSVVVIDNESSDAHDQPYWNDRAENHKLDILDYDSILPLFYKVDWVFHLAAEARIQPSIKNPIRTAEINIVGTCNVLQAARENNIKRLIYSGTSAAYGLTESIPQSEELPRDCLNPYSVSKCAGEDLCQMYTKLFGLETVLLRYFNVYGKNQPMRGQYAPVIGVFFRQYKAGESLTIVGTGHRKRDYICVSDVALANIAAAEASEGVGEIFNIGTGIEYSVQEVANLISDKQTYIDDRIGEASATRADISKAEEKLKWKPSVDLQKWISENHAKK